MKKTIVSNYERLNDEWAKRISGMDIDGLMKKLPELKREGDCLTIRHFARKYAMSLENFAIAAAEDDLPVTSNARLNIYTLLWYSREGAALTGDFKPFESLRGAGPFGPAFKKGVLAPFAAAFSGRTEALLHACEVLGGRRLNISDAGFELSAFDCIPVRYYFWDGDEEFPAQANMLFDMSCTDFIHVESIVTIATEGMRRIAEAAGVSLDRSAF